MNNLIVRLKQFYSYILLNSDFYCNSYLNNLEYYYKNFHRKSILRL